MAGIIASKVTTDEILMYLDAGNAKSFAVGATAWNDVSRGNKDGALQNGATFSAANNGAIVFDGIDDRVQLQNTNLWFPISSGEFTLDVWIKSPGLAIGNTYNGIISLTYGLTLSTLSSGDVIFRVYDSVLSTIVNLTSIGVNCNDNRWHHIVVTNDGTTSKIYIDGVFNTSRPVTFNGSTNPVWHSITDTYMIGEEVNNINRYFNGNISMVKVYGKALSVAEVLQNYNATKSRYQS